MLGLTLKPNTIRVPRPLSCRRWCPLQQTNRISKSIRLTFTHALTVIPRKLVANPVSDADAAAASCSCTTSCSAHSPVPGRTVVALRVGHIIEP